MARAHQWDVFISHSHADRDAVAAIAARLRDEAGLRPFLDRWHLVPGDAWQTDLADALDRSAAAAVCIGPTGVAPWHNVELQTALDRAVAGDDEFRVIPVLLPDVDDDAVPRFLAQRTWVDFRPGLDDGDALRRLAAAVRGEAIDGDGYELPDHPAPYRGLQRFDTADADFFFGRAQETDDLVARVESRRMVAVEGASGSGKSSLVRAGLLPRLAAGAVHGSERWHHLVCTPGSEPFRAVARQLARLTDASDRLAHIDDLTERLTHRADGLRITIGDLVADDPRPVLLVVDQFEELFTLCAGEPDECRRTAAAFVSLLTHAARDRAGRVRVLVTLRADFLGTALQLPGAAELLADPVLLGPLDDTALREVVAGPATAVGALFEKGLVGAILRDVHERQGALPLLQHALLELWNMRRGPWLTLDAYEEIGGVGGALARRADATFAALSARQQDLARTVLLRLVTHGEGVADTRRRVQRDELYPAGIDSADVDAVLQALSAEQARLVVADADTAEITHEALLREWTTLREWLDADRDAQRIHRRLTHAAAAWAGPLERDPGGLYRGAPLAQVEEWATTHADQLNAVEAAFLDASRQASAEELERERDRSRRLRRRLYASLASLAIAILGAAAALVLFARANDATARAEDNAARALAQQALALAPRQPALAVAVAAEALARNNTPEIAEALQVASAAFAETAWRPTAVVPGGPTFGGDPQFSPDGDRIATVADDTVTIWDAASGEERATLTLPSTVRDVVWSADGDRLATFHSTRVTVWDASTGAELNDFANLGGSVTRFSPDGAQVAVVSVLDGRGVTITDVASGEDLTMVVHEPGPVTALAWSTDGEQVVTQNSSRNLAIWDAASGDRVDRVPVWRSDSDVVDVAFVAGGDIVSVGFRGAGGGAVASWDRSEQRWITMGDTHRGPVTDVAFSPDARRAASASTDGTAKLWDTETGDELATLAGHPAPVTAAAFQPDGPLVATGGEDGDARLWDTRTGAEVAVLPGTLGAVTTIAWSTDGRHVAVASERTSCPAGTSRDCPLEQAIRVWEATARGRPPRTIVAGGDPVARLALSPDGDRVAAVGGSDDGAGTTGATVVFDTGSGEELSRPAPGRAVSAAAFAPDGDRLATAHGVFGSGSSVDIWRATTGEEVVELVRGASTTVMAAVAWSPDGERVAVARNEATAGDGEFTLELVDGAITIRDATTGSEQLALAVDEGWIRDLAWAPSGDTIAAATGFGATIWDTTTGDVQSSLTGHDSRVSRIAFDPEGERIATAGIDGTARIWDPATGEELRALTSPLDEVADVAFTPDGRHLATVDVEQTRGQDPGDVGSGVTFWNSATGERLATLDGHSGRINDVEFASDGRMATAGADRTVLLRDPVPSPGDACALVAEAVTAAELRVALAGDQIVACTALR